MLCVWYSVPSGCSMIKLAVKSVTFPLWTLRFQFPPKMYCASWPPPPPAVWLPPPAVWLPPPAVWLPPPAVWLPPPAVWLPPPPPPPAVWLPPPPPPPPPPIVAVITPLAVNVSKGVATIVVVVALPPCCCCPYANCWPELANENVNAPAIKRNPIPAIAIVLERFFLLLLFIFGVIIKVEMVLSLITVVAIENITTL